MSRIKLMMKPGDYPADMDADEFPDAHVADFERGHALFEAEGVDAYAEYQRKHEDDILADLKLSFDAISAQAVGNSAVNGQPAGPLLALAVLAGSLSHVLADGLTVAGVPLWWPFRRRRSVFLGALAFRTRSWAEVLVVLGVVAGVGWWVAG